MIGGPNTPKDSLAIEGELDKNGFTKVIYLLATGIHVLPTAKISKDGNKIEFRSANSFDVEMTRR